MSMLGFTQKNIKQLAIASLLALVMVLVLNTGILAGNCGECVELTAGGITFPGCNPNDSWWTCKVFDYGGQPFCDDLLFNPFCSFLE